MQNVHVSFIIIMDCMDISENSDLSLCLCVWGDVQNFVYMPLLSCISDSYGRYDVYNGFASIILCEYTGWILCVDEGF